MWNQLQEYMESEAEKIKDERRKAEIELQTTIKQIQIEREDAQTKLEEEAILLDEEIENHRRKLILEREKFRQELEQYDNEKKKIQTFNTITDSKIELNIGGTIFETSRDTCNQQKGSLLESILHGRTPAQRDKQGRIFLDRDAVLFKKILNFLRNPDMLPIVKDIIESENVVREAKELKINFFNNPLIYAIGGSNGVEVLQTVELLDIEQQLWKPSKPLQTPRSYFGAVTNSKTGKLFCYGGSNFDYKALRDMEIYDVLRNEWYEGPSMITPRRNFGAVSVGERLYSIGGFDGKSILDSCECYDPRMKAWKEIPNMNTVRSSSLCCVGNTETEIYVLGGTRGDRLRTVDIFDIRNNKWHNNYYPGMISIRSAGSSNFFDGKLFAIGGIDNNDVIQSSVEIFDDKNNRWSFINSLQQPRMDFASCILSNSLLVTGGINKSPLYSTEFYQPQNDIWIEGPQLITSRYGHQTVSLTI